MQRTHEQPACGTPPSWAIPSMTRVTSMIRGCGIRNETLDVQTEAITPMEP